MTTTERPSGRAVGDPWPGQGGDAALPEVIDIGLVYWGPQNNACLYWLWEHVSFLMALPPSTALPPGGAPGDVLVIDAGGNPIWAPAPPTTIPPGTDGWVLTWDDATGAPIWEPVPMAIEEVEVGGAQPADPLTNLWYDSTAVPPVLKVQTAPGTWVDVTSPEVEVIVGGAQPAGGNGTDMWFDTSVVPPVLMVWDPAQAAGAGGWVAAFAAGVDEVWVGAANLPPTDPATELWFVPEDTTTNPPTAPLLYGNVPGIGWVPLGGPINEVEIGLTDPITLNPVADLWYDQNDDGALKVRIGGSGGSWKTITQREVWVDDTDPYLRATSPAVNEEAEIWYDTTDDPGTLKVRHNGAWVNAVAREVWVDDEDPYLRTVNPAVNNEAELWYSTGTSTLMVWHDAGTGYEWIPVSSPEPPLDEVWVGTETPDPVGTHEVWYDTSTEPGVLRVKREDGTWEDVGTPPVYPDEVWVDVTPPTDVNTDLWADTSTDPPTLQVKVDGRWVPLVDESALAARDEVLVSPDQPRDVTTEMWYDTTEDPGTLKVNVDGVWVDVTTPQEPPLDEVWVGQEQPDPAGTHEIWYDTSTEPGILKVQRENGEWEVAVADEVAVGPDDPYVTDPASAVQLWLNTRPVPDVLMARVGNVWVPVGGQPGFDIQPEVTYGLLPNPGNATEYARADHTHGTPPESLSSEVEVTQVDPYLTDPESVAEMWFDPSRTDLWARVNDQWVKAALDAPNEFVAQVSEPSNPDVELWLDLSQNPAILMAKVNQVWQPIQVPEGTPPQPLNEVHIGPSDPYNAETELWYDSTADPGVLRANVDGVWTDIGGVVNEVTVGNTDPYVTDPSAVDELWQDTSRGAPGILKARVGGQWQEVIRYGGVSFEQQYGQEPFEGTLDVAARADHTHGTPAEEVVVDDTVASDSDAELWYNTTEDPGILMVKVDGAWVPASAASEPPLDEVWVESTSPDPAGTYEIWYDTSTEPGVLKIKRPNGAWEVVGTSEVVVDNIDPYITDPAATDELWFNPSMGELSARFNDQWLSVNPDAPNEFTVQGSEPTNPDVELWFDISTDPGVLKVKVNQVWQPVSESEDSPHPDEVWVDITPPTDPNTDLWYNPADTPSTGPGGAPVDVFKLPTNGDTGRPLLKLSPNDNHVGWDGPLILAGTLEVPGAVLLGGTLDVTDKVTTVDGVEVGGDLTVLGTANLEGVTNQRGQLNMGTGDKIQFPNETGPKIFAYAQTFGIGVESGELSLFGSSKVGFHANASNGALWAEITASGLGPRTNTNVSWQNGFTGSAQFRVNPAMVTLALWNFTNGVELFSYNPVKMFDYPAGVPAPWMNCSGAVMPIWMGSTTGYLPLRIDCRTDGVFAYAADWFQVGDLWECACTVTWAR